MYQEKELNYEGNKQGKTRTDRRGTARWVARRTKKRGAGREGEAGETGESQRWRRAGESRQNSWRTMHKAEKHGREQMQGTNADDLTRSELMTRLRTAGKVTGKWCKCETEDTHDRRKPNYWVEEEEGNPSARQRTPAGKCTLWYLPLGKYHFHKIYNCFYIYISNHHYIKTTHFWETH